MQLIFRQRIFSEATECPIDVVYPGALSRCWWTAWYHSSNPRVNETATHREWPQRPIVRKARSVGTENTYELQEDNCSAKTSNGEHVKARICASPRVLEDSHLTRIGC